MTKRQAAKVHFENETVAETIKENASRIFAGFPKIRVKYGRDKDSRDNTRQQMAQKRFTILESRDAELRDLLANVRDGAQVGICYDLCPEKERYRRIVQSDIAGFEKENGKVNLGTELQLVASH